MSINDKTGMNEKIPNDSKNAANTELGITQNYNRENRQNLWDDKNAKDTYKEKVFGEKQTIVDENTGNVIHKSQTAAQNKYHMKDKNGNNVSKKWAQHSGEVDHKVSLESLHEHAKYNPFLKDADLKEIANSECNYRVISKSENASKGAQNSADILTHAELHGRFAVATAKNAAGEFAVGAKNSIADSAETIIINNIESLVLENKSVEETLKDSVKAVAVTGAVGGAEKLLIDTTTQVFSNCGNTAKNAAGEFAVGAKNSITDSAGTIIINSIESLVLENKSVEETLKDSVKAVAVTGAVGGAEKLLIDTTTQIFSNCGNEVLNSIAQQNAVGQVLTLSAAVGKSLVKYIDGEIDEKELAEEIALNGSIIIVSTVVSMAVPIPFIAPLVSFVATNVATMLYETHKHMDDYLIREKQIKKIEREAIRLMDEKREQFKTAVNREFEHWDSTVSDGLYQLLSSSSDDCFSVEGMVSGLDKILSLCGTQAAFHSIEEYVNQLDQPLTLCF